MPTRSPGKTHGRPRQPRSAATEVPSRHPQAERRGFRLPRQERHQHRRDAEHRPPGPARRRSAACSWPSSSAPATSCAAPVQRRRRRHQARRPPTTWACWPPSSTAWPCRTPWKASTARRGCMTAIRMETVAEPYIRRRGHPPPGEGPHRHPGRRHRQSVRDHRHRRRPPRPRAGGRHPAQGHQGGRRLQRRSGDQSRTPSATRS